MKAFMHLTVVCAVVLLLSGAALAQTTTASVSGVVKDKSGAILPGVSVTVTNVGTKLARPVISDDQGRYLAPELTPGSYEVEASLTGFQTAVRTGIELTVGRHAIVDLTLEVGAVAEKVVVSGEAPLVETTSSSMAGLVNEDQIKDLPLNGRNFIQLSLLETGVVHARNAGSSTVDGGGVKISFHGARTDYNNFMMDGTSVNSTNAQAIGGASNGAMGVETIKEFQVITSNYSAEFGRGVGGIINVVTKSGTNNLRGSAFYFHRNDNLDARNFFDLGANPPEFKRNQFGLSVGGPIRKDKTFVFGGYEGLREGLGQTLIATVPSVAGRQGIIPGGAVTVDPGVRPYLDLWPIPNGRDFNDGTGEYFRSDTQTTRQDFFQARVDHSFADSASLFVRYTIDDSTKLNPRTIPTYTQTDNIRSQYVTIEHKQILSPTVLNVFRFGFNRTNVRYLEDIADPRIANPSIWFIPNASVPGLGPIGVSGLTEVGGTINRPQLRLDNAFQWIDTLNATRGTHSLKLGGEVQRIQSNENMTFRGQGIFTFANLRSFLLAQAANFTGVTANSDWVRGWRQTDMAVFVQDDWRVRSNLTLNLGLRWEVSTDPIEVNGKASHIVNPAVDSQAVVGNPLMKLRKANFGPRVGFAWDPQGNGKSSIRGGFGLFDQMIVRYFYSDGRILPPFIQNISGAAPSFPHPSLSQIAAPVIQPIPYDTKTPYMMHYNLAIQRELIPGSVLSVGYVGSRGLHLSFNRDLNNAVPQILADGRKFFQAGLQRRNPAWGEVRYKDFNGDSYYNGLQVKFTQRMLHGLQAQTSYTFARSVDTASVANGIPTQDPEDIRAERALSDFDVRHVSVTSFIYDVPSKKGLKGIASGVFGGWQVNGILNLTTGMPVTATTTAGLDRDRDRATTNLNRPDLIPGKSNNPVLGGPDRYFDPASFRLQDLGFFGTTGRNTIIGPGLASFDMGASKRVAIREGTNVQVRLEVFNLFNRANFGQPSGNVFQAATGVASGSVGRIRNTVGTSRQIQLGLKLEF